MADLTNTFVATHYGQATATATYGLQPLWYLVHGTGIGSADSTAGDGVTTLGNYSKAVNAIGGVASIAVLGTATADDFMVAVDNSFTGRGANDGATTLKSLIDAATGVTTTVTAKTLSGATFA